MESYVRCLRVSELVGLDFQEPYQPNRVAMQFGYDQDFPKWIPRSPSSSELAWYNYSRPIASDLRLYYPSRMFESDVTIRYLKWWRNEIDRQMENYLEVPPGFPPNYCWKNNYKNYPDVPPGFPPHFCWKNDKKNYSDVSPRSMQKHIAEKTVHTSIDGSGGSSARSMERS